MKRITIDGTTFTVSQNTFTAIMALVTSRQDADAGTRTDGSSRVIRTAGGGSLRVDAADQRDSDTHSSLIVDSRIAELDRQLRAAGHPDGGKPLDAYEELELRNARLMSAARNRALGNT